MAVPCEKMIPFGLPSYEQLICSYDAENRALWYYMSPKPRRCFTPTLLREIKDLYRRAADYAGHSPDSLNYLVAASATPEVFNLGGDLDLFRRWIGERNKEALRQYGYECVDALYQNAMNLHVPSLTTISLVQGTALGGGLEGAISSNVVIAEASAELGFPEILFNLFPGMGAYSLLVRRVDIARAERLLRTGLVSTAKVFYDMGIVDVLANDGEGVSTVNDYIRRHSRARNGLQALQRVRQRVAPLDLQELRDIVDIWVDAALRLTSRDLRLMGKFTAAQTRLQRAGTVTEESVAEIVPRPLVAVV